METNKEEDQFHTAMMTLMASDQLDDILKEWGEKDGQETTLTCIAAIQAEILQTASQLVLKKELEETEVAMQQQFGSLKLEEDEVEMPLEKESSAQSVEMGEQIIEKDIEPSEDFFTATEETTIDHLKVVLQMVTGLEEPDSTRLNPVQAAEVLMNFGVQLPEIQTMNFDP